MICKKIVRLILFIFGKKVMEKRPLSDSFLTVS